MKVKFGIFGNPINHSLSPQIHQIFAQQANIDLEYRCIQTDDLTTAVTTFQHNGGIGANVTVPFKQQAYDLATTLSPTATIAQAVNTLHFTNLGIFGDNTDGAGLVYDLTKNIGIKLQQKNVLIIGAGGAVRGILAPLLQQNINCVIANRTFSKAQQLAQEFASYGEITANELSQLSGEFDLIINATASSLQRTMLDINSKLINANTIAYDLMYSRRPTQFMNWASDNGAAKVFDGLGMLVSQAAFSFALWHNFMPVINPVLESLK